MVLSGSDASLWGIESKFTEPFNHGTYDVPFRPAYFAKDPGRWSRLGLPRCQALAERLRDGEVRFSCLDVPQLLKHALGLRRHDSPGSLVLLWHRVESAEAEILAKEIASFAAAVDEDLGFRAVTYQEVFERLGRDAGTGGNHTDYREWLRDRYFAE